MNASVYPKCGALLSSLKHGNKVVATELASSNARGLWQTSGGIVTLLLNLFFTILVYSFPIIIYRYAIKKSPVEKKKAKAITIIYGICAFIAMSFLISAINGKGAAGGAILLWSWVNYRMLTGETTKDKKAKDEENDAAVKGKTMDHVSAYSENDILTDSQQLSELPLEIQPDCDAEIPFLQNVLIHPQIKYCRKCGYKLINGSYFCDNCGTKIVEQVKTHNNGSTQETDNKNTDDPK